MPTNFTLSSGASFTIRDQTIHGDTGNTTISDSYNTTTTKVVGSHNTSTMTDNGTYYNNYYNESYSSKRYSRGNKNSGKTYKGDYNYNNYHNIYSQPQRDEDNIHDPEQYDANSNYGLPLGSRSPRTPPPAPTTRLNQLPTTPATPSPFHQPQPFLRTPPPQEQTFQSFAIPPATWTFNTSEPPTQNVSPQPTGLGLRAEIGTSPRSPNPFTARIQSRATSPSQPIYGDVLYSTPVGMRSISSPQPAPASPMAEAYGNFGFQTPRTEAGMISPLHLPRA